MPINKHKKLQKRHHLRIPSYGEDGTKEGLMLFFYVTEMIQKSS